MEVLQHKWPAEMHCGRGLCRIETVKSTRCLIQEPPGRQVAEASACLVSKQLHLRPLLLLSSACLVLNHLHWRPLLCLLIRNLLQLLSEASKKECGTAGRLRRHQARRFHSSSNLAHSTALFLSVSCKAQSWRGRRLGQLLSSLRMIASYRYSTADFGLLCLMFSSAKNGIQAKC